MSHEDLIAWGCRFISWGGPVWDPKIAQESRDSVCVCVCPPLDKGSSTTTLSMLFNYLGQPPFIGRGVEQACRAPLNKALCSVLRISARTLADVPARSFTSCYSNLPLLIHGSSRFPPHKHSSPAAVQPVHFPPLASANIVQQYSFS